MSSSRPSDETRPRVAQEGSAPSAQAKEVNGADFMAMLDPGLRQAVLVDADDNTLAALPDGLQAEARSLRGEHSQPSAGGTARALESEAQSSKPAILVVHGAWHCPAHFDKVTDLLREDGYTVSAPQLPSVGIAKDPGNALALDAEAVTSAINELTIQGKNVVVVMHSYGGMAGSEGAAKYLSTPNSASATGRILKLVYLTAYVMYKGGNVITEHTPDKDPRPSPVTVSEQGLMTHNEARERFYHLTDPKQAEHAISMLKPMALSAFLNEQEYGGLGWAEYGIPVLYIGCKNDGSIPLAMQEDFVRRMRDAGIEVDAEWLETDHSPFINSPNEVAKLIEEAAGKM